MKVQKLHRTSRPFVVLIVITAVIICCVSVRPLRILTPHIPPDFTVAAPYTPPTSDPPAFTIPQIITAACRKDSRIVSLFTSGIDMTVSQRNLTAVACRIGSYVVPALSFEEDVLHCPAESLKPGDVLAPVLLRDQFLRTALKGPVTLPTGVVATLSENDLLPMEGLSIHPSLDSSDLALVPSEYTYQPSLPGTGWRWQVCLMIQIKPATYLLPDWIDYHRRIGVDRVFIFDNGATTDIASMFRNRNDVEVISWPYHKTQMQLVGYFLHASRNICEHVLHMDADEYYMFGLGSREEFLQEPPLPRYLRQTKQHGFSNFRLPYIVIGNSGYRLRPPGPIPENYVHLSDRQVFSNGKSVCSTDVDYESGLVHGCGMINSKIVPLYIQRLTTWGDINMHPSRVGDPGFVVHFRKRSWEDWIERTNAGWAVGKLVSDPFKGELDIEKPHPRHMAFNASLKYTHFRDVFRRVSREGRLDRAFTVRIQGQGTRCIREVNTVRQVLPPGKETCWHS